MIDLLIDYPGRQQNSPVFEIAQAQGGGAVNSSPEVLCLEILFSD